MYLLFWEVILKIARLYFLDVHLKHSCTNINGFCNCTVEKIEIEFPPRHCLIYALAWGTKNSELAGCDPNQSRPLLAP